jgi:glycosyltransferase involved in cell wall biosynthesis
MKLAVVDNLPEGGAKRVVFEQVKGLSQEYEIDYYTNTLVSRFPFDDYVNHVHRYNLTIPRLHGFQRVMTELLWFTRLGREFQKMAALINKSGAKMAMVHPCMITQSPMILRYLTIPSVYFIEEWLRVYYEPELHPILDASSIKRGYEMNRRWVLANADRQNVTKATRLVTTSTFNQGHVQNAYARESELIPLGVDTDFFTPPKSVTRNHFLFVGNKEAIDGHDLLEQAISQTNSRPKITYVGCDGVTFDADDEKMKRLYQGAVATLCLARSEPFGLAPLESMACGTPVIAVDEGGYRDTIIHDKTGRLIPRKPDALVEAMLSIAQDKKAYVTMSRRARKRVEQYYSWSLHIKGLKNIIEEVVND